MQTQRFTTLCCAKGRENLPLEQAAGGEGEGKGSSTHNPVLYWALHGCSVLYPLQHTERFDVIATITMDQAI